MKRVLTVVLIQLAASTATGFCFTLGSAAWKKISEQTGLLQPNEKEKP